MPDAIGGSRITLEASMRPRVFPAEDVPDDTDEHRNCRLLSRFNEAAGIPRGRLDSAVADRQEDLENSASMRPRVFPAEDAGFRMPPSRLS